MMLRCFSFSAFNTLLFWWLFIGLRIIRPVAMVCMALAWADLVGEHTIV